MEKVINTKEERIFLDSLKDIVKSARKYAYSSICFAQVQSNWLLGKRIVEQSVDFFYYVFCNASLTNVYDWI